MSLGLNVLLLQPSNIFKFFCGLPEVYSSDESRKMKKPTPTHFSVCEKSIKLRKTKIGRIRGTQNTTNEQINKISELIEMNLSSSATIFAIRHNVRNTDFAEIGPGNENQEIVSKKTNAKVCSKSQVRHERVAKMQFGCKNSPGN